MIGLGLWQLERLAWKNELIVAVEIANEAEPAVTLPAVELLPYSEYKKMRLTGHFFGKELLMTPRYWHTKIGYNLVQPFKLQDGTAVLVNRGWVPVDKKEPGTRLESMAPKDAVTVEGDIRKTGRKNWVTPDNNPEKNLWFWYDIPAMEKALKMKGLPEIVIDQTSAAGQADLPRPNEPSIHNLRNDHLGYAITWFATALAGLLIWLFYHLERKSAV